MADITFGGLGSGLKTGDIVKALADAEKAPKQKQINTQTQVTTTSLTAIGSIQTALDAYRAALGKMNRVENFTGISGSSSANTVATVAVGSTASNGTYELKISQLATASKIASKVFDGDASAIVNGGTDDTNMIIEQAGNKYDVSIKAGATLQEVRDTINSQLSSKGISANILSDDNGSRLVLSSSTTGKNTDLVISGDSGLEAGGKIITSAQNAEYTIDDLPMESSTNTVAAAVSGVSITLLTKGESIIGVSTSNDVLKTSVKGFVDSYNALMSAINTVTKVSVGADGNTSGGGLTGDATLRALVTSVRNELVSSSGSGAMKTLSEFGISTVQKTGLLEIDDKKWSKAVASNGADIAGLFTDTDGLISRMTKATDSFAQSKTGILASRSSTLSDNLSDLTVQQATLDRRIENLTRSLSLKYNTMDTLVGQLTATRSSIMTTLNALNKTNSD